MKNDTKITINFYPHRSRPGNTNIRTNSKVFEDEIYIEYLDDEKVIFAKSNICHVGKSYTMTRQYNFYHGTLGVLFPLGEYPIDQEESSEDRAVIYFEDMIVN